jgi:hypothetical protein
MKALSALARHHPDEFKQLTTSILKALTEKKEKFDRI